MSETELYMVGGIEDEMTNTVTYSLEVEEADWKNVEAIIQVLGNDEEMDW